MSRIRLRLFLFAISGLIVSCSSPDKHAPNGTSLTGELVRKAGRYAHANPDSALSLADSALAAASKSGLHDTVFLQLYQVKAEAWLSKNNRDSAIANYETVLAIAARTGDSVRQAQSLLAISRTLYLNNDVHRAERYFPMAIALFEKMGMTSDLGWAYAHYGGMLTMKGDFREAQSYLMKAYKIFERLDSLHALSAVCVNLGNNLRKSGSSADALQYFRIAADAARKSRDTINIIGALNNMGLLYKKSQPDSAIYFYRQALALIPAGKVTTSKIMGNFNIANIYVDKKEYARAKEIFGQVLDYCQAAGNAAGVARAYSGFASVYKNTGNNAQAAAYLKRGIQIADSLGDLSLKFGLIDELYPILKNQSQFKDALVLSEQMKLRNDSILALDKIVAVQKLKIQYQSEKKEMENSLLKSEVVKQQQELRYSWIIIIVTLLFLAVFIFLLWRAYTDSQRGRKAEIERERMLAELREANANIKTLTGLLPICSSCKKIRDDQGYWNHLEAYISEHSDAQFSHGICPDCYKRIYPEIYKKNHGEEG